VLGNLDWQRAVDLLGGELEGERIDGNADFAFSVGRFRVVPGAEAIVAIEDDDDPFAGASLGGLFRLSGYAPFELFGDEAVLGRVVAYRRLNRKVIRRVPASLYAGISIEGGNVFRQGESIDADELLYGATAFLGADTPLGPLIFGFGYTDPDRTRAYLAFGRSFF
jgi:NTE family protein